MRPYGLFLIAALSVSCSNPLPNRDFSKIVVPLVADNSIQNVSLSSELTPRPKTDTIKSELTPRPKTDTLKSELTPRPKTDTLKSELTPRPKSDTLKSELAPRPKNETILTGRASLPEGFRVQTIPLAVFQIQVYDLTGHLLGETTSNEHGDYAVTNIPIDLRVKVKAQALQRPTAKLSALVDIPSTVGGTAIDQNINARTTAIALIVENAQKQDSSLKNIPLGDYEMRSDLSALVLKVEQLVESVLNENFDQEYAEIKDIQTALQEVRRDWEVQENQLPTATPTPEATPTPVSTPEATPTPTPVPTPSESPKRDTQEGSL